MNTLSRRHRLRQQLAKSHQDLSVNKENQREHQLEGFQYDSPYYNNNNHHHHYNEDDQQSRVYQLVAIQPKERPRLYHKSTSHLNGERPINDIHSPLSQQDSLKQASYIHECSTGSSMRSTGDSSGFVSEETVTRGSYSDKSRVTRDSSTEKSRLKQNRNAQSKLIDDLDRLMLEATRRSTSPTESYISFSDSHYRDSTLARGNEFDCSTLCRDEFSSFIPIESKIFHQVDDSYEEIGLPPESSSRSGPMLVGVHESHQTLEALSQSSESSENTEPFEMHQLVTPESLTSPIQLEEESEYAAIDSLPPSTKLASAQDCNLSGMLDSYLTRVKSLIRLSKGDRSVSLDDAFDGDTDIDVSEEHRTVIEFPTFEKPQLKYTVTQEMELSYDEGETHFRHTNVVDDNFRAIMWTPQVSATLNWDSQPPYERPKSDATYLVDELEGSLLDCLRDDHYTSSSDNLVIVVRRHLSEFIDAYNAYQSKLASKIGSTNDWHQNWLFAYKRPNENSFHSSSKKRAKLSCSEADLIKYSTLMVMRNKSRKVTYPTMIGETNIERVYQFQEDPLEELRRRAIDSIGQVDVCRMLLCDTENQANVPNAPRNANMIQVRYESNSATVPCFNRLRFAAYGYLFDSPRVSNQMQLELKRKVLSEIGKRFKQDQVACRESERVKFSIDLSNVELTNKLPVIQFCAKVSGALPIQVRWFRLDQDGQTEISSLAGRHSVRIKSRHEGSAQPVSWPIEMQASYDYEYQNEWSSLFRFRRIQDEILFEIREASLEHDYNKTYKCLIQNCYSQEESCFSLRQRQIETKIRPACSEKATKSASSAKAEVEDKRALLRTWSQRTLHKAPPRCVESEPETNEQLAKSESSCWQMTVGRRSELMANENKFGENFPYHPENLIKRLEANKFCISTLNRPQESLAARSSLSRLSEIKFTDSFEIQFDQQHQQETPTKHQLWGGQTVQTQEDVKQESLKREQVGFGSQKYVVPAPRQRLKVKVANQDPGAEQRSRSSTPNQIRPSAASAQWEHSARKLDECHPKAIDELNSVEASTKLVDTQAERLPKASVKSLISRFS